MRTRAIWNAQEIFIRQLAGVMKQKNNIIGFDFGNEINTCWATEPNVGDAWMAKMFTLMESVRYRARSREWRG